MVAEDQRGSMPRRGKRVAVDRQQHDGQQGKQPDGHQCRPGPPGRRMRVIEMFPPHLPNPHALVPTLKHRMESRPTNVPEPKSRKPRRICQSNGSRFFMNPPARNSLSEKRFARRPGSDPRRGNARADCAWRHGVVTLSPCSHFIPRGRGLASPGLQPGDAGL
jgi:hypothetical protein